MSKLSFRARALDPTKTLPIYLAEELPDLPEYSAINRAVPQMPSGMEKEEESEHHLQRAICAGLLIPTPEVYKTDQDFYDRCYPPNYKMPRQLIHMQPLGLEQDVPEYDMDSADEAWVEQQGRRLDLTPYKFEQMMDRLEKSSGQMVVKLNEAKALLKQDDEVSIALYDYWLNKRLKMQHPLILSVKTESRLGASSNNPYLAFRRRTEKMQTRKNRKNDETSYEKMLKLRRDLQRATTILEMVKKREQTKRESLHLSIQIFEKRATLRDFNGSMYTEMMASLKSSRPAFVPMYPNQYSHHSTVVPATSSGSLSTGGATVGGMLVAGATPTTGSTSHMYSSTSQYLNSSSMPIDGINTSGNAGIRKEKRQYKKRKHKVPRDNKHQPQQNNLLQQQQYLAGVGIMPSAAVVGTGTANSVHQLSHLQHLHRQSSSPAANESNIDSEEEDLGSGQHSNKIGSESEDEAPFAFRRKPNCSYLRPKQHIGNWPWESEADHGFGDPKYRFTLTSIRYPSPRCIGFARRRMGRGGRVILDRASTNLDEFWSQLDYSVFDSNSSLSGDHIRNSELLLKKSFSPPTVIDLPKVNVSGPSSSVLLTSKYGSESNEKVDVASTSGHVNNNGNADNGIVSCDDNYEEDFDDKACGIRRDNISLDEKYTSGITFSRKQHYLLEEGRRKRLRHNKGNVLHHVGESLTKRKKLNNTTTSSTVTSNEQTLISEKELSTPVFPPELVQRLSYALTKENIDEISHYLHRKKIKREKLNGEDLPDEVVIDLAQQKPNHRANNVLNINNNNSSSNINKNVSVSEAENVIKNEADETIADQLAKTVKQEIIEATDFASADDSNEPLSSMRRAVSTTTKVEILEDEENVNLARLSSLMRHTATSTVIKEEIPDSDELSAMSSDQTLSSVSKETILENDIKTPLNRIIINNHHSKNSSDMLNDFDNINEETSFAASSTSSQRFNICNELLTEIRSDWLHFRPKTPTDELLDGDYKLPFLDSEPAPPLVDFTQHTPISIEMLRLSPIRDFVPQKESATKVKSLWDSHLDEPLFVSNSFKYTDLEADTQLMQPLTLDPGDNVRGSSKSPDSTVAGNSNPADLSGDSLADINLLGEGDETDEKMLDNILQECQIDDIKTLNQATNFWNGILDGEAVDEVRPDLETAAEILDDCTDDKKMKESRRSQKNRNKHRNYILPVGSSKFLTTSKNNFLNDDLFFKKDQPKISSKPKVEEPTESATETETKDEVVFIKAPSVTSTAAFTTPSLVFPRPPVSTTIPAYTPQTINNVQQQLVSSPKLVLSSVPTTQPLLQTLQKQQLSQIQLQHQSSRVSTAVGDIITINNASTTASPHGTTPLPVAVPSQLSLQQQQPQQHQILQIHQSQVRGASIQQLHQLQQQQIQRQQQTQLVMQMQREFSTTGGAVIAHYVPATSVSTATTLRQPTLTPIGSQAIGTGSHMIYTTTSADGTTVPQKIYIQKANPASGNISQSIVSAASQVPTSLSTNSVITLSNVKLDNDSSQSIQCGTNFHTVESNTSVASTPNVNIISTVGGQQLAVHNISGGQHTGGSSVVGVSGVNMTTTTSPLIVTSSSRGPQQITQQQQLGAQSAPQIVWRQINTSNTSSAGVLTTTEATNAVPAGSKIVWTTRPGTKRHLNGPEGTDLNKLLLNRNLSQRKFVSQPKHQIHIPKQQLAQFQQQQLQQQQEDGSGSISDGGVTVSQTTTGAPTATQVAHQQQLQKIQMQAGKVIKMSSFPVLVSELNVQQQQQQKHNSAAIAANHNYSLQPAALIASTSQAGNQNVANKIYLTSTNNGGNNSNITITSGEMQSITSTGNQKLQYKDFQNSNLKVNFLPTSISGGSSAVGTNIVVQQQQPQHQTLVLNKSANTQQQKLKRDRILNIIGATSNAADTAGTNATGTTISSNAEKRVLYTSLLNMKPLQKNNASGQMQMQLGPGGMTHVLRGRISNNQTIFTTNMRSVPIATSISNVPQQQTIQQVTSSSAPTTVVVPAELTSTANDVKSSMENNIANNSNSSSSNSSSNNNSNSGSNSCAILTNSGLINSISSSNGSSSCSNSSSSSNSTIASSTNSSPAAVTASTTINRPIKYLLRR